MDELRARAGFRGASFGCVTLALACGLLAASCTPREPALPPDAILAGDASALVRALRGLARLEGTPLARSARELAARLEGCEEFAASAPVGELGALLDRVTCAPFAQQPASLQRLRGDADLVFVLPLRGALGRSELAASSLTGTLRVAESGSLVLTARGNAQDLPSWLVPAAEPAGPGVLSTRNTLVHARFRPELGLDLAALVPEESQADRMFRLKSELFAGAVLAGALEAAVYLPPEGRAMPLLVVAVDVALQRPALAAVQQLVRELEATWPIHHAPVTFGQRTGACFFDLAILPEFAPCYAQGERALLFGWNPDAIAAALLPGAGDAPDEAGGLLVHFDRMPAADRRLQSALAPDREPRDIDYAWSRLQARADRESDQVEWHLELKARGSL